jgi:hypothetical protein
MEPLSHWLSARARSRLACEVDSLAQMPRGSVCSSEAAVGPARTPAPLEVPNAARRPHRTSDGTSHVQRLPLAPARALPRGPTGGGFEQRNVTRGGFYSRFAYGCLYATNRRLARHERRKTHRAYSRLAAPVHRLCVARLHDQSRLRPRPRSVQWIAQSQRRARAQPVPPRLQLAPSGSIRLRFSSCRRGSSNRWRVRARSRRTASRPRARRQQR